MSVIYKSHNCYLIDHCNYLVNLYKNVLDLDKPVSYTISKKIFSINSVRTDSGKKCRVSDEILEEAMVVKEIYEKFIQKMPMDIQEHIKNYCTLDTHSVRELSKKLFETTIFEMAGSNGGNNSKDSLKCNIFNEYFLIPYKSRFFCGCVNEACQKLEGNKFDIVIADPPWWNKYIRRLKSVNNKASYSMMYNKDIAAIPLKNLLSDDCLVIVWCTNGPSNISAVKDLIFPQWGVQYVTTWYWLKITTDLNPLCDFSAGSKKQPYERIIIGKLGNVKSIPQYQLIVSIPSALHSHKPPLLDLFSVYLDKEDPKVLELFARYLLPNATSVGYEPLKWQHISLYEQVS